jgi:hypothetical protein
MFRPCLLAPQTFDATRALSTSTWASWASRGSRFQAAPTHDRLVQTGAVNPADAAYSDVCIPMAVTLFLWE